MGFEVFTKKDLRTKMIIELTGGSKFLVVDDIFIGENSFTDLNSFDEQLYDIYGGYPRVERVYKPIVDYKLIPKNFSLLDEHDIYCVRVDGCLVKL